MNLQLRIPTLLSKCLLTLTCFCWGGSLSGEVESLFAQGGSELTAVYGRGVHAYFGCDSTRAEELLSEVIMAGSRDPRVYYFRGLARLKQGRQYEAEEDFRMGAELEARDPGRRFAIGTALQRIQGTDRQTLERFRREGRLQKYQERRGQNQMRYEDLRSRESDVLHQDAPVPLEDLVIPSVGRPVISGDEQDKTNSTKPSVPTPSSSQPATPAPQPKSVPAPTAPAVTPEEDPFGSVPAQKPAAAEEEDPFSAPAKAEPESAPAAEPEIDDLFSPAEEPAATEAPAPEPATPAPAAENDLFGAPTPGPADPAPAKAESPPAEDPFGTEPADKPAPVEPSEEDPFGAPADSSPGPEPKPAEAATRAEDTPQPTEPAPVAEDDPFGDSEVTSPDTAFDEPTADERVLDQEVAHNEDAEAAADQEAQDEAKDVGAFVEEPAGTDPFGEPAEEPAAEESAEEAPPAEDTSSSEEPAAETAPEEDAAEEGEMTDEAPAETSTEDEDPFGGF